LPQVAPAPDNSQHVSRWRALSSRQDAGPVNALAKAYVEVNGKPAPEKEVWTRKLTFREIKK
jgi:hypothetical protein